MYAISAKANGAVPVAAPETQLQQVDAMLAVTRTKRWFFEEPNRCPRLHNGLPEDVILVIDSAYSEYVVADYDDCLQRALNSKNMVSPAHSQNSMRWVGFVLAGWLGLPPLST